MENNTTKPEEFATAKVKKSSSSFFTWLVSILGLLVSLATIYHSCVPNTKKEKYYDTFISLFGEQGTESESAPILPSPSASKPTSPDKDTIIHNATSPIIESKSKSKLVGNVFDENGNIVPHAIVYINSSSTTTNSYGQFEIEIEDLEGLDPLNIEVIREGKLVFENRIHFRENQKIKIQLKTK